MSSRREIVTAVEYPWIDPEFPDPVEDPMIAEAMTLGVLVPDTGPTIDIDTYRKQRQQPQPAAD
jgi:hypothetical protein